MGSQSAVLSGRSVLVGGPNWRKYITNSMPLIHGSFNSLVLRYGEVLSLLCYILPILRHSAQVHKTKQTWNEPSETVSKVKPASFGCFSPLFQPQFHA